MLAALAGHNKRQRTVLNTAHRARRTEQRRGVAPCAPDSVDRVNLEARRYGVAVGLCHWRREMRDIKGQSFTDRPRPRPRDAVYDALSGLPTAPPDAISADRGLLPISALGAGMRGSLLCIADLPASVSDTIVANALGSAAMHAYP